MKQDFGLNQGLVEELYLKYCANPQAVDPAWRKYFDNLPIEEQPDFTSVGTLRAPTSQELGNGNGQSRSNGHLTTTALVPPSTETTRTRESFIPSSETMAANELQGRVSALINAYRVRGHLFADLDPLGIKPRDDQDLLLERYGLQSVGKDTVFSTGDLAGPDHMPLQELIRRLKETYCRTIGVEFTQIEEPEERRWLQQRMEVNCNRLDLDHDEQIRILTKLTDAEIFEQFLHTNYVGAKRFSLEGAESFIPLMDLLIDHAGVHRVEEVVIGMAHRGRLNVLANIMEKVPHEIFADFEDGNPETKLGRGDVKYHLGYSTDRTVRGEQGNEHPVHLTLSFNPSHLEFVGPVVEGRVRAKQSRKGDSERSRVLPLLIHGDAALAGQGVVAETLNLSTLNGYDTGGTVHIVINNQIGFTTDPEDARSTRYCTDIARMLRCPVFHVNGEDPEAVAQVARLATEYRQTFHRDVFIDLYCYRKYGHNEGDEPRFTQPNMYNAVDQKRTVREVYVERLLEKGQINREEAEQIKETRRKDLEQALQETRRGDYDNGVSTMEGVWSKYRGGPDKSVPDVKTRISEDRLKELAVAAHALPEHFTPHPKVARLFKQRVGHLMEDKPFDWGTAEVMAYASLVEEGVRIRISGQDACRGTFSHRHAVAYDHKTGHAYAPLQHIARDQGKFHVFDSPLSEAGVLGFDYGFALDSPDALVIWEAQFGDFVNGAQVAIDQFITSSEDKWHRLCGLVMLLPHGFEGQGPEHSSARLERFLSQCAEDNIQVCNLTTPAQIFHCLRRQQLRPWRKPLVIMSPKSLLRHPMAKSTNRDLTEGQFQRIIADPTVDAKDTRRVVLCSGKLYYDLLKHRQEQNIEDVALVRLEQLYPIRGDELKETLKSYKRGTDLVWAQEEPWNMGAWFFMNARLPALVEPKFKLRCIAREESASPATGSKGAHDIEQSRILERCFEQADRR